MYPQLPQKKRVKNKIIRTKLQKNYMRFKLLISLRAIDRLLMLFAKLKIIELAKAMFVFDIQNGQEVFTPDELGQNGYPQSYQFYDPIMRIIQEDMPDERKQFFYSKKVDKLELYKQYNFKEKLYDRLFNGDKKATFKYEIVNKRETKTIDHHTSEHTMCLQRSRYLSVDHDL